MPCKYVLKTFDLKKIHVQVYMVFKSDGKCILLNMEIKWTSSGGMLSFLCHINTHIRIATLSGNTTLSDTDIQNGYVCAH